MAWNEHSLHRWLARSGRPQSLLGSALHDSAVLRPLKGAPVVCVDACIEGVHFEEHCQPALAGAKAAGRALSDLAASAAKPYALLLSLRAPADKSEAWMRAAIRGVRKMGARHGAELVGGDLSLAAGPAQWTVTALGVRDPQQRAPGRDRLRAGDQLWVTGALGGSLLGRHLRIRPRWEAAQLLEAAGAHALMDISDGLCIDLWRMAHSSRVRIDLDTSLVPIHRDARRMPGKARWHALHDGEDHELLVGAPRKAASDIERAVPEAVAIAGVTRGPAALYCDGQLYHPRQGGYLHGT